MFFLILYCYAGYPVFIWIIARLFPRPVKKSPFLPDISILIAVYNEEDVIGNKIKNLLRLDYPPEKMEILIGSDGSTDRTNEIIKSAGSAKITLIENATRRGKIATINELASKAKGAILVFTDARQEFARTALAELTANFADPSVGCVSGELIFAEEEGATAKGINLYWNYEKFIRGSESRVHSMLGATGAIYAIRKELFVPPPETTILDDMYIPFRIILRGYRAILDGSAKAYDRIASTPKEEYRRKTRTLYGNYQIFSLLPQMFIPFKSPIALQLFSHKFLRVAAPFILILLFVFNWLLVDINFYFNFLMLQSLFYASAAAGFFLKEKKGGPLGLLAKTCYIPYVFCLLNFSALAGFWRFLTARQEITWDKAREK